MRNRQIPNPESRQFRWVILLLAVAVILPTVCLLWFMSQAVKNERLAVRQKLINAYQQGFAKATRQLDDDIISRLQDLDRVSSSNAYSSWCSMTAGSYDGIIIFNGAGKRIFPVLSAEVKPGVNIDEVFEDAWQLEFEQQNYSGAIAAYDKNIQAEDVYVKLNALIAKSRCLKKLGKLNAAIETCKQVAFAADEESVDVASLMLIANSRVYLLELLKEANSSTEALFKDSFDKLLQITYRQNGAGAFVPADRKVFLLRKIAEIYTATPLLQAHYSLSAKDSRLRSLEIENHIATIQRSIKAIEHIPAIKSLSDWQVGQHRRIEGMEETTYGLIHTYEDKSLLILRCRHNIARNLGYFHESGTGLRDITYRIVDDAGSYVAGTEDLTGKPFAGFAVSKYFPGFKVEIHLEDANIFDNAAGKQTAIYTWTGVLVVFLILTSGAIAAQAIGRQAKLNRLKNDFIATVTHELKTPLSSMRVLVDTLLEGNYNDQQQATEYLQLISKENGRLSRLIDNFLTFSRMERNKQAFDIVRTNPAGIAEAAIDAVQAKFNHENCRFSTKIDDNPPSVMADKDAIVTVLVNLLDNAYKYSHGDKRIELKVFSERDAVYFSVADNGIGMTSRQARKIFDRFYQADSSLTRRTQGAGLGLAIVKFIVDAHDAEISVDSRPGEGSTFIVKLPAVKERHSG